LPPQKSEERAIGHRKVIDAMRWLAQTGIAGRHRAGQGADATR
jgi:hypothetical protein